MTPLRNIVRFVRKRFLEANPGKYKTSVDFAVLSHDKSLSSGKVAATLYLRGEDVRITVTFFANIDARFYFHGNPQIISILEITARTERYPGLFRAGADGSKQRSIVLQLRDPDVRQLAYDFASSAVYLDKI